MARTKAARSEREGDTARGPSASLVTVTDPSGAASEAYRGLRTNLLYAQVDAPPKVILVTSPGSREGKSTICANLGATLAQSDRATLVIDCDLRGPTLHRIFGLDDSPNLLDVLAREDGLGEVWQEPLPKLKVVTGGPTPPNPAELLGSRRFSELLGRASRAFDHVLLDAPPVEFVSDAAILATQADGVLLAMDAQKTRKVALRRTVRDLQLVGANVLGVVVNNVEDPGEDYPLAGYAGG
jgi:capsular exopolysaccharide synthesis family protein